MYKVVNEPPPPITDTETGQIRPRGYDAIVATALTKDPDQRYPTAAAFRAAIRAAIGRVASDSVSESTVIAVPSRRAPTEPSQPHLASSSSARSTGHTPTNWDATVLSQVETTLARHVGPVATVLVRRVARDCADLATLYARLAEQVTSNAARDVLLAQARQAGLSTVSGATTPTIFAGNAVISDAVRERAERLLAQQVGPIARVLVKKAAASSADRAAFVSRLAEAITDTGRRQKFCDELMRLG
jgi:serine/threonine-protein kinase